MNNIIVRQKNHVMAQPIVNRRPGRGQRLTIERIDPLGHRGVVAIVFSSDIEAALERVKRPCLSSAGERLRLPDLHVGLAHDVFSNPKLHLLPGSVD